MNEKQQKELFRCAVDRRLSDLHEDPFLALRIMNSEKGVSPMNTAKKKNMFSRPLAAAAIAVALIIAAGTVAFALGHSAITDLFTYTDKPNESITEAIQIMDSQYDGEFVKLSVNEALYDRLGGTCTLGWSVENLDDENELYIICDGIAFGGEKVDYRTVTNMDEYVLGGGTAVSSAMHGTLPDNDSNTCTMGFTVLRSLAPFMQIADYDGTYETALEKAAVLRGRGYIPLYADGTVVIEFDSDVSYAERLLATGQFELAERFSLNFEVETERLDETLRVYNGAKSFVFDDYEIRIRSAFTTATTVHIDLEYITPEKPLDGGKGIGPMWDIIFTTPEGTDWTGNASGSFIDPVQLEDGRWMSVYEYEAIQLFEQPEALCLTLAIYEMDGERLVSNEHTEDTIELIFE